MLITAKDKEQGVIESLHAYNASKRWEKEIGGIKCNGLQISTDDRSKTMVSGARIEAENNQDFTTQWKTETGFITINASQIIDISNALLRHVSDCFAKEYSVSKKIEAGEVLTTEDIDALWEN